MKNITEIKIWDSEVEVEHNGEVHNVKIKKPLHGTRKRAYQKWNKTKIIDGQVTSDLNELGFKDELTIGCIVEGFLVEWKEPNGELKSAQLNTVEGLEHLSIDSVDKLSKAIEGSMKVPDEVKKN